MQNNFKDKVLDLVKDIPKGQVLSYADVAQSVGSPKAYRAVAIIMSNNYDDSVPCHRVIRSDGTLGEYNRGGTKKKKELLINEGYIVK